MISGSRDALLSFQNAVKYSDNEARRIWLEELAELKKGNAERNYDRITDLESKLNDASERVIKNKIGNFIKKDVLNSEKKTPLFLRLAQEKSCASLEEIKDDAGLPFSDNGARDRYITEFYSKL